MGGKKERTVSQRTVDRMREKGGLGPEGAKEKMQWKEMTSEGVMGGRQCSPLQRNHPVTFWRQCSAQGAGTRMTTPPQEFSGPGMAVWLQRWPCEWGDAGEPAPVSKLQVEGGVQL